MITDIQIENFIDAGADLSNLLASKEPKDLVFLVSFTKGGTDRFVEGLWRAEEFLENWLTSEESFYDNRRKY